MYTWTLSWVINTVPRSSLSWLQLHQDLDGWVRSNKALCSGKNGLKGNRNILKTKVLKLKICSFKSNKAVLKQENENPRYYLIIFIKFVS